MNEMKWELEEQIERNRQYETEFQGPKDDSAVEWTTVVTSYKKHQWIEESSKKTKEILRLKKERADLSTKSANWTN